MPPRHWKIRIEDILRAIDRVQSYTRDMNHDSFQRDQLVIDAVIHNFTVVGEATLHIPEEILDRHSAIPWADMRSMRNLVVHEYFGVGHDFLRETIQHDLPALVPALSAVLSME